MEQTRSGRRKYKRLAPAGLGDLRVDLLWQRRIRISVMIVLIVALMSTMIYGTLENPFEYTLSNIGNFFNYRIVFIIWAIVTGIAIQMSFLALFRLEEYSNRNSYVFIGISVVLLVLTAIVPALKDQYPFWHLVHELFAGLHALFLLLAILPFLKRTAKENPRLRRVIAIWLYVIWAGGIASLILLGKSAIFELWFFISLILFLLYLSLVLFEEKIVKMSVVYMKDEPDLNAAIEKLFVNRKDI